MPQWFLNEPDAWERERQAAYDNGYAAATEDFAARLRAWRDQYLVGARVDACELVQDFEQDFPEVQE